MKWYIVLVGLLHAAFMVCEMYPWNNPILLGVVAAELPGAANKTADSGSESDESKTLKFTPEQQRIVATIVHNAGIYNAIIAAGLFWAAYRGKPANEVAIVLFVGAAAAGIFGTATLRSPVTVVQAVLGIVGVILMKREKEPMPT